MFFFAFCLLIYFLPSIIAHEKRSFTRAFSSVNLLLGWTVIGWIAALIWACVDERRVLVYVPGAAHGP